MMKKLMIAVLALSLSTVAFAQDAKKEKVKKDVNHAIDKTDAAMDKAAYKTKKGVANAAHATSKTAHKAAVKADAKADKAKMEMKKDK